MLALALKRGFPAAAARVDAARGHRRYCGAVRGRAQLTLAVAPSICGKKRRRALWFDFGRARVLCNSVVSCLYCDSEGSVRIPQTRPPGKPAAKMSSSTSSPSSLYPRHSHSFVTTSAQNFVKGPLRVAFKSTNNRVQRRPRHHEFSAVATGLQPVAGHGSALATRVTPAVLPHTSAHSPRSCTHALKDTTKSAANDTRAGEPWPSRSSP